MKDEIKEILDKLEGLSQYATVPKELAIYTINLNSYQTNILLDYITNLQQEIKRLKQWDCNKDTRNSRQRIANAKQLKQLNDYKSRIDKAIEDITIIIRDVAENDIPLTINDLDNILKDLQGSDNNESRE